MALLLQRFIENGYNREENQLMKDKLQLVDSLLKDVQIKFENTTIDWAEWDDTYEFVLNPTPDYIKICTWRILLCLIAVSTLLRL